MKKTKKSKTDEYKLSIKILGRTYESNGKTMIEALNKLDIKNVKGVRGIITVEHGQIKKDRILMPLQANRLFNSYGLMKEIAIKNISYLFQGL